jgi:DmsE family decaheme c-type cytochrome
VTGAGTQWKRVAIWLAAIVLALSAWQAVHADEPAAPVYSQKGADSCMSCHDEPAVKAIFKTKHAASADERTPFAHLQCESCHGPGGEHAKRLHPGDPRPPIPMFGKGSTATVAELNGACLSCHQDGHRVGWNGSVHQREDLKCVSCHTVHAEHDPVTEAHDQPQVCYQCHRSVRVDFDKFSAHPVRDGNMSCSACHAPHDSLFPALLNHPTVNQTCTSCHAQMRGPFLWEHPPAAEDCGNCHTPHGSVNQALLTMRPPMLCQQCHSAMDHPSLAFTGENLPGRDPSGFVLAGSCTNCHSHVHGSNAPSGADLSR